MKKNLLLTLAGLVVLFTLSAALFSPAQEKSSAQKYECALIKWDGNDKVYVNLPDRSELVRVAEVGKVHIPKDMQEEEFYLAWMCNKLAKEGWEPVNLDSRRILLRRPVGQPGRG